MGYCCPAATSAYFQNCKIVCAIEVEKLNFCMVTCYDDSNIGITGQAPMSWQKFKKSAKLLSLFPLGDLYHLVQKKKHLPTTWSRFYAWTIPTPSWSLLSVMALTIDHNIRDKQSLLHLSDILEGFYALYNNEWTYFTKYRCLNFATWLTL